MYDHEGETTNKLVKSERRGVWISLAVILILASTLFVDIDIRRALLTGLAVAIVFAVAWLGQKSAGRTGSNVDENRQSMMHDEWRMAALARAYKWAFVAVLAALSAFCIASAIISIDISASILAALMVALGVIVFLCFFLLFDRA